MTTMDINDYNCPICKELLTKPITLTCQHTFCTNCIETHYYGNDRTTRGGGLGIRQVNDSNEKCPLCNIPYVLSPFSNNTMDNLLKAAFPDEHSRISERNTKEREERALRNKIESDMRTQVWNMLSTNFNTHTVPLNYNNSNNNSSNGAMLSYTPRPVSSKWITWRMIKNVTTQQILPAIVVTLPISWVLYHKLKQ